MNKKLILIFSLVIAGLFFFLVFNNSSKPTTEATPMTVEAMTTVLNKALSESADTKPLMAANKVMIVNFWASFCSPCIQELPSLIELKKKMGQQLELVFVNEDSDLKERDIFLKSFPELTKNTEFKHIYDQDGKISRDLAVDKLPESFVLDCHHKVVKVVVGAVDWKSEGVVEFVEGLNKECSAK